MNSLQLYKVATQFTEVKTDLLQHKVATRLAEFKPETPKHHKAVTCTAHDKTDPVKC